MMKLIRNKPVALRQSPGYSLIEVLFAIGILGVGLLALASLFPIAMLQQRRAMDDTEGTLAGRNVLAMLQAYGPDVFPASGGQVDFVANELLVGDDGRVADQGGGQGNRLTSATADFTGLAGKYIYISNGQDGYLRRITSESGTSADLDQSVPANPDAGPNRLPPYNFTVQHAAVALPPPDPAQAYDYRLAYRQPRLDGPIEVAVLVFRQTNARVDFDPGPNVNTAVPVVDLKVYHQDGANELAGELENLSTTPVQRLAHRRNQYLLAWTGTDTVEVLRVARGSSPMLTGSATEPYVRGRVAVPPRVTTEKALIAPYPAVAIVTGVIQ